MLLLADAKLPRGGAARDRGSSLAETPAEPFWRLSSRRRALNAWARRAGKPSLRDGRGDGAAANWRGGRRWRASFTLPRAAGGGGSSCPRRRYASLCWQQRLRRSSLGLSALACS